LRGTSRPVSLLVATVASYCLPVVSRNKYDRIDESVVVLLTVIACAHTDSIYLCRMRNSPFTWTRLSADKYSTRKIQRREDLWVNKADATFNTIDDGVDTTFELEYSSKVQNRFKIRSEHTFFSRIQSSVQSSSHAVITDEHENEPPNDHGYAFRGYVHGCCAHLGLSPLSPCSPSERPFSWSESWWSRRRSIGFFYFE
jgi:hypothetical protein